MNADTEEQVLTETGSEFQTVGDATLKDREPKLRSDLTIKQESIAFVHYDRNQLVNGY